LESRAALANRQGGRGRFRRMLITEAKNQPTVRVLPPPPLPCHRRAQTTAANRVDESAPRPSPERCCWTRSAVVDSDTPPAILDVAAGGMAAEGSQFCR